MLNLFYASMQAAKREYFLSLNNIKAHVMDTQPLNPQWYIDFIMLRLHDSMLSLAFGI